MLTDYMKLLLFCLIAYFFQLNVVTATMIFRKVPQSLVARVSDNVTLDCVGHSTNDDVSYVCSWQKDGSVVFVGEGLRKRFYAYTGDTQSGDCSVQLRNIDVGIHHGRWTCTVVNTDALNEVAVAHPVSITVLAAPTYPEIQDTIGNTVSNLTVIEGRVKQLHCLSRRGNPAASLSWTLGSTDISSNATFYNNSEPGTAINVGLPGYSARTYTAGSWLPLLVNRSIDGYLLQCTARHEAYGDDGLPTVQLRLNVVYPPVNVSDNLNVTATSMDDPLHLECPLNGKPEPNYTWYWLANDGRNKKIPIGYDRLLYLNQLDNLSGGSEDIQNGGYMCSASNLMDREHHIAFSGMFVVIPTSNDDAYDPGSCSRDDIAFSVAVILGSCALLSLAIELTLLVLFRKRSEKGTSSQSSVQNIFYELYRTRGRKMTVVHVRTEQDSKGGKRFSLHLSSTLISLAMVFVDIITIVACTTVIYFCFSLQTCDCQFDHPSIVVTIAFGSLVIICQIVFFTSFCIRKTEDSKFKTYARNKNEIGNSATNITSDTKKNQTSTIKEDENKHLEINKNVEKNNGEVPGTVLT